MEFGSVSLNVPGESRIGSVGKPLPGVRVELAPDGEIIVHREPTVARAYFECAPGESERTFLGSNRVATGDIGRFDADGFLYLTGRKKEIIVTSGGEKVHPETIESQIDSCPDVVKAVVFQIDGEPGLTAVVVQRAAGDAPRRRIQEFLNRLGQTRRAISISNVIFTDTPFSRENGLLRPNLKLDRKRIAERFGQSQSLEVTQ
jgi:long-subunit acyl-CoA synthetase (AMP-forming)